MPRQQGGSARESLAGSGLARFLPRRLYFPASPGPFFRLPDAPPASFFKQATGTRQMANALLPLCGQSEKIEKRREDTARLCVSYQSAAPAPLRFYRRHGRVFFGKESRHPCPRACTRSGSVRGSSHLKSLLSSLTASSPQGESARKQRRARLSQRRQRQPALPDPRPPHRRHVRVPIDREEQEQLVRLLHSCVPMGQ